MELKRLEREVMSTGQVKCSKTAIVWGREDLLGWTVEFLLHASDDWEVVRVPELRATRDVLRQVEQSQSEVVILYQGNSPVENGLVMRLLEMGQRVIQVDPQSNVMEVYSRKEVQMRSAADFMAIVQGA